MKKRIAFSLLTFLVLWVLGICLFADKSQGQEKDKKLSEKYKKWMDEEVIYIISETEKEVFQSLISDEQREKFIKSFWKRRDPSPHTPFNEFREEHYRRIEYVNKKYFEGKTGWRTDRGRVYIMFGPPDFVETNPGGGKGFLFEAAETAEFPSEIWRYQYIAGLKTRMSQIEFIFVNYYNAGSYQLTTNPALANALRNISTPARYAGYEDYLTSEDKAASRELVAQERLDDQMAMNPLEQLSMMAELQKSRGDVLEELERSARLRRLRGIVDARESIVGLNFVNKLNFFKGERGATFIPLSVEIAGKDVVFKKVEDRYKGTINFFIEIKNDTETVYQTSDRLEMNLKEDTYQRRASDHYQYIHGVSLLPGDYFLHLVVWDENNNNVGYIDERMNVPEFPAEDFKLSTVILARGVRVKEIAEDSVIIDTKDLPVIRDLSKTDLKVPDQIKVKRRTGGPFTFDNLEINPNTLAEYTTDEELAFFYQIYNPTFDETQKMAKLSIEHQIWKDNKLITTIEKPYEAQIPGLKRQVGINGGARFSLKALSSGKYSLLIRVIDIFSDRKIEKKVDFLVK
ncbi:GWxTD domain-containing protein [Acidobacteriota bacterium]